MGACNPRTTTRSHGSTYRALTTLITGCKRNCECSIDSETGYAYMPSEYCRARKIDDGRKGFLCTDKNGILIDFNRLIDHENIRSECTVVEDSNENCILNCKCKDGFIDYINSDGEKIKCGKCKDCQCPVNLETGRSPVPAKECDHNNLCPQDFTDQYEAENTIECHTVADCDLQCTCRDGYTSTTKHCDTFNEQRRATTPSPNKNKNKDDGYTVSEIVGISIGGAIGLILLLSTCFIAYVVFSNRQSQRKQGTHTETVA